MNVKINPGANCSGKIKEGKVISQASGRKKYNCMQQRDELSLPAGVQYYKERGITEDRRVA